MGVIVLPKEEALLEPGILRSGHIVDPDSAASTKYGMKEASCSKDTAHGCKLAGGIIGMDYKWYKGCSSSLTAARKLAPKARRDRRLKKETRPSESSS